MTVMVVVADPIVVGTGIQVGAPITLNAVLGHSGLWTGDGPPTTVAGAVVGDEYLDNISGTIYRLTPGE